MNKLYVHNLRQVGSSSKVKAFADVTIGNAVTLRNIRLVEGEKGEFVAMPSRKYEKDGEIKYSDIFYPKSEEVRGALLNTLMEAYTSDKGYAYFNGEVNPELTVTVSPVTNSETSLKAWATLGIDDDWVIRNIAVNETDKGLVVNFPSQKYEKAGETKYNALVAPENVKWKNKESGEDCSKDYGKVIAGLIINAYKPTLTQQIDSAENVKESPADQDRNVPKQDMEK